jgi:ELWxxDGT repeat protein
MFLSRIRRRFTKAKRSKYGQRGRDIRARTILRVEGLEERVLLSAPPPSTQLSAALVSNIVTGEIPANPTINEMVDVPHLFGNTLFFTVTDGSYRELWISDGTAAGTVPVRNARDFGFGTLNPENLAAVGNTLFFAGSNGQGEALWKSDGTAAGTVVVKDFGLVPSSSAPNDLIDANGRLFFVADDGRHGPQIWTSDGTTQGTIMVTNIATDFNDSGMQNLTSINHTLYFTANVGNGKGRQLWEHRILFGNIDLGYQDVGNLTAVGTSLFFEGIDQNLGGGAVFVLDAKGQQQELAGPFSQVTPDNLTNVNGTLFFTADDQQGDPGIVLWSVRDIHALPTLIATISSSNLPSSTAALVEFNGLCYFGAEDANNFEQLWDSDGTVQGTHLVQTINPIGDSSLFNMTVVGTGKSARLFFTADDGTHGDELWSTDGAPGNATLVRDIVPGPGSSNPRLLTAANHLQILLNSPAGDDGTLYFTVNDAVHGDQLWRTGEFAPVSISATNQVNNEGDQVSVQVQASGGTLTYSASNLPPGLTIDSTTGLVSGTMSLQDGAQSPYAVTVTADDGGFSASAMFSWTVIDTTTPVVQNPGPQSNNEGNMIQLNITATDADNDPLTYSATNLPTGLSIDPKTGIISGTVGNQAAGTYAVTVSASDGQNTGVTAFSWNVVEPAPPTVTNPGTQYGNEGNTLALFITATDDDPLVYSAVNLPPGLTIDSATGKISGTLGNQAAGTYQVTVYADNGTFKASAQFTWNVFDITTPVVANPGDQMTANGAAVNLAISATDADNDPLTYSATNLPPGLSIDPNTGLITGTVSLVAGRNPTFDVTIFVSDGFNVGSVSFTWTVLAG